MKQFVILLIFCVCTAFSQTYYMNIRMTTGGVTSIPVQDIRKLTFTKGVGVERLSAAIKTFTLLQNYPNPFNPTTTIEYQLPSTGTVNIRIFNVNGQLVHVMENANQVAGTHRIVWNGKNNGGQTVASGMYFYQVKFKNSILAKKMLFIK
jgi:hypothetical protein